MVKETSYFHLDTDAGLESLPEKKARRDGGVASKHKVPLSTCSETHLECSLDFALLSKQFWPVAQRTVTSLDTRETQVRILPWKQFHVAERSKAPNSLFSTYSPAN